MLKRYFLFVFDENEAGGGWHDFHGDYDTLDEVIAEVFRLANDGCDAYPQIIDGHIGEDVTPDDLFKESRKIGKQVQKMRKESPLRFDDMDSIGLW